MLTQIRFACVSRHECVKAFPYAEAIKLPVTFTEEILSWDFVVHNVGIFEFLLLAQTTVE